MFLILKMDPVRSERIINAKFISKHNIHEVIIMKNKLTSELKKVPGTSIAVEL